MPILNAVILRFSQLSLIHVFLFQRWKLPDYGLWNNYIHMGYQLLISSSLSHKFLIMIMIYVPIWFAGSVMKPTETGSELM